METVRVGIRPLGEPSALRTPRRRRCLPGLRKASASEPRRRRSLFDKDECVESSDLSDISPLSKSSSSAEDEVYSPPIPSPAWSLSPRRTPIKCISPLKVNFDQLLIGRKTPVKSPWKTPQKTPQKTPRKSPRVKGVSPLGPDHGVIPPRSFYGNSEPIPLDGVKLIQRIRASLPPEVIRARTRLFLDDIRKEKKRARTSSGGPKRKFKKAKLHAPSLSPENATQKILAKRRLLPDQPKQAKKPKAEVVKEPKTLTTVTPKPKKKCNWEWFGSGKSPCLKSIASTPKSSKKNLDDSEILTPPPSVRKSQKLMDTTVDYLGSPRKSAIVEEIRSDVLEMIQDEEESIKDQVEDLLRDLENDEPVTAENKENNDSLLNVISTPPAKSQFFPVFNNSASKTPLSEIDNGNKKTPARKFMGQGSDQYQIDAGQRGLCETQCSTCGLFYSKGDPQDEIQHEMYHNHFNELKYHGWKNERVVGIHGMDRIVCIVRSDPKSWWEKAKGVITVVDSELGFPTLQLDNLNLAKVFLYIKEKRVVGCIVAEVIQSAFRMLESDTGLDICSQESYPAKCGISRIWVHTHYRRSHIATRMLDTVRCNFMYGSVVLLDSLAFTVPTEDGKRLAKKYTKRNDFLVYM